MIEGLENKSMVKMVNNRHKNRVIRTIDGRTFIAEPKKPFEVTKADAASLENQHGFKRVLNIKKEKGVKTDDN